VKHKVADLFFCSSLLREGGNYPDYPPHGSAPGWPSKCTPYFFHYELFDLATAALRLLLLQTFYELLFDNFIFFLVFCSKWPWTPHCCNIGHRQQLNYFIWFIIFDTGQHNFTILMNQCSKWSFIIALWIDVFIFCSFTGCLWSICFSCLINKMWKISLYRSI
jgi:hypothetical protein